MEIYIGWSLNYFEEYSLWSKLMFYFYFTVHSFCCCCCFQYTRYVDITSCQVIFVSAETFKPLTRDHNFRFSPDGVGLKAGQHTAVY